MHSSSDAWRPLKSLGLFASGAALAFLLPDHHVRREMLPLQGGIEIAECLPDGTRHGHSETWIGYRSSERDYVEGLPVRITEYDPQGNVILRQVEGEQFELQEEP